MSILNDSSAAAFPRAEILNPKQYCVYVIQSGGRKGPVKIGYTGNIAKRIVQIQTGSPNKCTLIGLLKCRSKMHAVNVEAGYHAEFAHHRIMGEWFDYEAAKSLLGRRNKTPFIWTLQENNTVKRYTKELRAAYGLALRSHNLKDRELKRKPLIKAKTLALCDRFKGIADTDAAKRLITDMFSLQVAPPEPYSLSKEESRIRAYWTGCRGIVALDILDNGALVMEADMVDGTAGPIVTNPADACLYSFGVPMYKKGTCVSANDGPDYFDVSRFGSNKTTAPHSSLEVQS